MYNLWSMERDVTSRAGGVTSMEGEEGQLEGGVGQLRGRRERVGREM
jgi:hypothetical protein